MTATKRCIYLVIARANTWAGETLWKPQTVDGSTIACDWHWNFVSNQYKLTSAISDINHVLVALKPCVSAIYIFRQAPMPGDCLLKLYKFCKIILKLYSIFCCWQWKCKLNPISRNSSIGLLFDLKDSEWYQQTYTHENVVST